MRFWVSWYQPTDDFRPLTYPPNEAILGWWCTGFRCDDAATICALVEIKNNKYDINEIEEAVDEAILEDWPEAELGRFCEPVEDDWLPGDRFQIDDDDEWIRERLGIKK